MTNPLPQQVKDNLVDARNVAGRGNGLFATRDLTPKSQVLFVARPLMIALETAKLPTNCYLCYRSTDEPISTRGFTQVQTLKTCSGCKTVKFCDQKCQTGAWKEYHKLECKLFGRLQPRVLPSTVRAIVRVLKQHKAGMLSESEWAELLSLESHYDELLQAGGRRWQDVFIMMKGIKTYCGTEHTQDTILRLACMVLVNSFTLTDPSFNSLGMVLHPKPALMNHSCDPNTFVRFDVRPMSSERSLPPYGSVSVHALRPISRDEEITTSYVDSTMPFYKRQEELKTRYFFNCSCSVCSRGTDTIMDAFHLAPDMNTVDAVVLRAGDDAEQTLLDLQSKASILHTQIPTIKSAMKLLADTQIWPLYRYPYPQLRRQLLLGLLAQNRYFEAVLHVATFLRAVQPILHEKEHHPLRIMETWLLSNLCRHCVQSLIFGEETVEDFRLDVRTLGLLSCVLVHDMHRVLNDGVKTDGQMERSAHTAYLDIRSEGGAYAVYRKNPDAARRQTFSWLDKQVQELLKGEGVAEDIIELSFSRRGSPG